MTESAFKRFNGEQVNVISTWVCSDGDGMTYLHTIEHSINELDCTDESEAIQFAIQQAKESAIIQAAIIQAAINNDSIVYVLQIDLPDESLQIDRSCRNMEYCRCIDSDEFDALKDNAIIHRFEVNLYFHVFRLAGLIKNEQFNVYALDGGLIEACEIIAKTDCSAIYDSLYD
jgi:hypothetical protein